MTARRGHQGRRAGLHGRGPPLTSPRRGGRRRRRPSGLPARPAEKGERAKGAARRAPGAGRPLGARRRGRGPGAPRAGVSLAHPIRAKSRNRRRRGETAGPGEPLPAQASFPGRVPLCHVPWSANPGPEPLPTVKAGAGGAGWDVSEARAHGASLPVVGASRRDSGPPPSASTGRALGHRTSGIRGRGSAGTRGPRARSPEGRPGGPAPPLRPPRSRATPCGRSGQVLAPRPPKAPRTF